MSITLIHKELQAITDKVRSLDPKEFPHSDFRSFQTLTEYVESAELIAFAIGNREEVTG